MSVSLYWKVVAPCEKQRLSFSLKNILARHLWDQDGGLRAGEVILDHGAIPFLEGVMLATSDEEMAHEAQTLINAIKESRGRVVVWIDE